MNNQTSDVIPEPETNPIPQVAPVGECQLSDLPMDSCQHCRDLGLYVPKKEGGMSVADVNLDRRR